MFTAYIHPNFFSCPPNQWKIVKVLSVDNPRIEYARSHNDHWNIDRAT